MIPQNFHDAIHIVCGELGRSIENKIFDKCERNLWWELCCCILSSQVQYDLAVEFSNKIRDDELLMSAASFDFLENRLFNLLFQGVSIDGRNRRYRFPKSKAAQIAKTKLTITKTWGTLSRLLAVMPDARVARQEIVSLSSGVGPKQASMFLRNCGVSYDLAIIDRHVLNYANYAFSDRDKSVVKAGSLKSYLLIEDELKSHAKKFGYKVGVLDLAIWIVMKSSREINIKMGSKS